jgi:peptide deformylase
MHKKIIQLGDQVLRQRARKLSIEEILSEEIQLLIEDMKETMRAAPGVGLAAPQIGVPLQLAVIEDSEERMVGMLPEIRLERNRKPVSFHVLINPILSIVDSTENLFFEGCLSVAGRTRITPRANSVYVEYLDQNGTQKNIRADGWYARILQHEIDHLNGQLYVDISDERTEILVTEINRKELLNSTSQEINKYFKESTSCQ